MKKLDFISVGDTTLDIFLELEEEVKIIKDKTSVSLPKYKGSP